MTVAAVKLADLIERARVNARNEPADARSQQNVSGSSGQSGVLDVSLHDPIALDIERLAVKLYSLSRSRAGSPGDLMREALRSIERCLVSMKRQH